MLTKEPPANPRTREPRARPPRHRPRPRTEPRARAAAIAAGALIVLIGVVVAVRGCQSSGLSAALNDYANKVSILNSRSAQNSADLLAALASGESNRTAAKLNAVTANARRQLREASRLDTPFPVKAVQRSFMFAMQMRYDAVGAIAQTLAQNKGSGEQIAADTARLFASDVLYRQYVAAPVREVRRDHVPSAGRPPDTPSSLPSIAWLTPAFVQSKLGAAASSTSPAVRHGHSLDSVSFQGTALQAGQPNPVPATPPPTFTLDFTNGGQSNETGVSCRIAVAGTTISGQKVIAQTTAGRHARCQVTLNASPPPGSYSLTATIGKVPGETNSSNNTLSVPITFS